MRDVRCQEPLEVPEGAGGWEGVVGNAWLVACSLGGHRWGEESGDQWLGTATHILGDGG